MKLFRYIGYSICLVLAALLILLLLAQWRLALNTAEANLVVEMLNVKSDDDIALVGLQTELYQFHYQDAQSLERALDHWLTELRASLPKDQTLVVVLPEHIGTWLVAANEAWLTYLLPTTNLAFALPILRQPFAYFQKWQTAESHDRFTEALFTLKATSMWLSYREVMTRLARRHKVTLIAGSIVLPYLSVDQDGVSLGEGKLYNQSLTFSPEGEIVGVSRKRFLILDEQRFIASDNSAKQTFSTAVGNTQVLICADSWYPESWSNTDTDTVVLIPSLLFDPLAWQQPWQGYNGAPMPDDVDAADVGRIKEFEAWERYALAGRGKHLRAGMNVFGHDRLWQMQGAGQSLAIANGKIYKGMQRKGALASVLWIRPMKASSEFNDE